MTIRQIKQLATIYEEREQLKLDLIQLFELFCKNRLMFESHMGDQVKRSAIDFLQATATLFGGTFDEDEESVYIPLNHGIYTLVAQERFPNYKIIFTLSPKVRLYEDAETVITEEDVLLMNEETRFDTGDTDDIGEIPTQA